MRRVVLAFGLVLALASPSWAVGAVGSAVSACGANGGTTGSLNTTTAKAIVAYATGYYAINPLAFADSNGITWTALTAQAGGSNQVSRFYYAHPGSTGWSVGSGHTFTVSGTSTFSCVIVVPLTGTIVSPFDVESGTTNNLTNSLAPGSFTPSLNREVVLCGYQSNGNTDFSTAFAVGGGFSIKLALNSVPATNYGTALTYLVQTTAAAANPTGTWTTAEASSVACATFKASGKHGLRLVL